ncbi:lysozyme inhibitor LprI family protein [Novosphingobium sp.]|uniref:lysozyme inhibitor LprI family protein n=1 Tax=Novosphingobium sp. TaxID=1874826 RepID=UPI0025D2281E|nr:lysozyme inhibitor LprI family protein [Novosphingobium sp.]
MSLFLYVAVLAGPHFVDGIDGEPVNCIEAEQAADVTRCELDNFQAAEKALEQQLEKTITVLRNADERIDHQSNKEPGFLPTLRAAQRAWLTYRDETCVLERLSAQGDGPATMLEYICKTSMTEQRTTDLFLLAGRPEFQE